MSSLRFSARIMAFTFFLAEMICDCKSENVLLAQRGSSTWWTPWWQESSEDQLDLEDKPRDLNAHHSHSLAKFNKSSSAIFWNSIPCVVFQVQCKTYKKNFQQRATIANDKTSSACTCSGSFALRYARSWRKDLKDLTIFNFSVAVEPGSKPIQSAFQMRLWVTSMSVYSSLPVNGGVKTIFQRCLQNCFDTSSRVYWKLNGITDISDEDDAESICEIPLFNVQRSTVNQHWHSWSDSKFMDCSPRAYCETFFNLWW